jgi:EmrB/QacA subfamily drug resistance transporter
MEASIFTHRQDRRRVEPSVAEKLNRNQLLALGAMALAVFVIANDVTSLTVALPQIEKDFDSDLGTVQWVINAYALVFGVFMITGGRLADMFGRRRMFFVGCAIFVGFSLLAAAAPNDIWLIVARALMGLGGALMWPATLAMTFNLLPQSRAGLAGGLIIGAAGFGNAAGPLIGGLLTDAISWRAILVLNLPVAAVACLACWRLVTESRDENTTRKIDYAGIASLTTALIALLLALDQVTLWGWGDPRIIGLFVVCAVLLVAFVLRERSAGEAALVPRDVMSNLPFRAVCLVVLLISATFFAALFFLPQFQQKILGSTPLEAGLGLLPFMGMFAITSLVAGRFYDRLGPKVIVTAGAACLCLGGLLISLIGRHSGIGDLVPGMLILGIGAGLFYSSVTTAAVTALDPSRAGLAGGIVYMFQVAGGSIGLGLTTAIFTTASQDTLQKDASFLTDRENEAADGLLAGTESALRVAGQFSKEAAEHLEQLVRDAFVDGMHWGFRFVAALALASAVTSALVIGGRRARR